MPSDKPTVAINLDTLERPDRPAPFGVVIGGKRYVMRDVQDLDYRVLLAGYRAHAAGDPEPLIRTVVNEKDQDEFFGNRIPAWKLGQLFEAYNEHYGIDPGEASASPTS